MNDYYNYACYFIKNVSFRVIKISSDIYFIIFSSSYFEYIDKVKLVCIKILAFKELVFSLTYLHL